MRKARKLTAIILVAVMTLSLMVPVFASAAEAQEAYNAIHAGSATLISAATAAAPGSERADVVAAMNDLIYAIGAGNGAAIVTAEEIAVTLPTAGTHSTPAGIVGSIQGSFVVTYSGAFPHSGNPLNITLPATPWAPADAARNIILDPANQAALIAATTGAANEAAAVTAIVAAMDALIADVGAGSGTATVTAENLVVELPITGVAANPAGTPGSIRGTFTVTYADGVGDPTSEGDVGTIVLPATWLAGSAGESEFIVDGEVIYLDRTHYRFILPTSNAFGFILDPIGLARAEVISADNNAVDPTTLEPGLIVPTSPGAHVLNLSSRPMGLTVTYSATVTGTNTALIGGFGTTTSFDNVTDNATPTPHIDSINRGTNRNVLLYLAPSSTGRTTIEPDAAFVPSTTAATRAFPVVTAERVFDFRFDAADFGIFRNPAGQWVYEIVDENVGVGTSLQVGGHVNQNPNVSWDGVDVELNVVFSFAPVAHDPAEREKPLITAPASEVPGIHALIAPQALGEGLGWSLQVPYATAALTLVSVEPPAPPAPRFGDSTGGFVRTNDTTATLTVRGSGVVYIPFVGLTADTTITFNGIDQLAAGNATLDVRGGRITLASAAVDFWRGQPATWGGVTWIITVGGIPHTITINNR